MKYLLPFICIVAALAVFCPASSAADSKSTNAGVWTRPYVVPVAKVGRGAANILKAPLDVPVSIYRHVKQGKGILGKGKGLIVGTVKGVGCGVARVCAGAAEVITAPIVTDTRPLYTAPLEISPSAADCPAVNR